MRRFRPPQPVAMTLNLAPLVDVMMCLIIFFLLAGKLVSAQHQSVQLAHAETARDVDRADLGTRVVINVLPGQSSQAAIYTVSGWDGERISLHTLEPEAIPTYLQTHAQAASARGQALRCVIRADREVAYGDIETVLRACGLAKVRHIVFSVYTGQEAENGK